MSQKIRKTPREKFSARRFWFSDAQN